MRILHTSDWHLGRSFHQVGLLPAQQLFIDHLVDQVAEREVDAVLVAGDVYDRALPGPQTVEVLDDALARIVAAGAQVVLTSGNHDSAVRLGFGSRLMEASGVHLRTGVDDMLRPVEVDGARIYALPYLEPSVAAPLLGEDVAASHLGVLGEALRRVAADAERFDGPVVVSAHAFVTGAVESESERDISVGGIGDVPASLFEGFDYAALGHIHGRQEIRPHVRYSGSPVAMSFSEQAHTKSSWLVELPPQRGGALHVEAVEAPVLRPLATLRGDLLDLLADPVHEHAEEAWCRVILTDDARPLDAMNQLRQRFPYTVVLEHQPARVSPTAQHSYASRVRTASDAELVDGFLTHVRRGRGPDERERAVVAEAIEQSRIERAEAVR